MRFPYLTVVLLAGGTAVGGVALAHRGSVDLGPLTGADDRPAALAGPPEGSSEVLTNLTRQVDDGPHGAEAGRWWPHVQGEVDDSLLAEVVITTDWSASRADDYADAVALCDAFVDAAQVAADVVVRGTDEEVETLIDGSTETHAYVETLASSDDSAPCTAEPRYRHVADDLAGRDIVIDASEVTALSPAG